MYTVLLPIPVGPVSLPEPVMSTGPQLWATEPQESDSPTVLFTYRPPQASAGTSPRPHHHLKAPLLHSSLPRWGLSCPYPNPAPGSLQEKTPFRSGQPLGRCGGRGEGGLWAVTPTRRKGGHPGVPNFPLSCFSSLLETSNRNSDLTNWSPPLRTSVRIEGKGNGGSLC